jgi:hypothetical protein
MVFLMKIDQLPQGSALISSSTALARIVASALARSSGGNARSCVRVSLCRRAALS